MENDYPVFRSLEIIESRISEKLTVENIAKEIYFSKYHYQRLFRQVIGDSVMEYVTKRKLTLAGRALLETNAAIVDIAMDFGYDSREGFARSFKAYMGVTPTEYRKYGLTAISQKTVKEKNAMLYSKTTNEIVRELNEFIAKAKETADYARKSEVREYASFWQVIADSTDTFADRAKNMLEDITSIAEHPDDITNRFKIIKVIEDISFQSNLLAFNAGLYVSRGQAEHIRLQQPICERYLELAQAASIKSGKIAGFFNELASLIFDDMRKTAADKISMIIQKGRAAVEAITGYDNIRYEVSNVVDGISAMDLGDITISTLEDFLFRLNIIAFAADIDVTRYPGDKGLFQELSAFKESLAESIGFFSTLAKPESNAIAQHTTGKHFQDVTFQMNILLFYLRGELANDKLGRLLDAEQKNRFGEICERINGLIQFMHSASEKTSFKETSDRLDEIVADMHNEANRLNEHGGAVKFIITEVEHLAGRVRKYALE